ncbi:MAG TPA: hypothetical protein VI028_13625 [Solirubrobacterales bacterium]
MSRPRDGSRRVLRLAWSLGLACLSALLVTAHAAAFGPLSQYGPAAPGANPGQLSFPIGVTIGPDGNVYVDDSGNDRIAVFAPGGAFLRTFGAGQVDNPEGGAFDTAGNFYVASQNDDSIVVFNPQGAVLRSIGGAGSAAGQLLSPEGVSLDQQGNVYVPEFFNARVSVFTSQGAFLRAFGWSVATGASALEVCTTSCQQGVSGGGAGQLNQPRLGAVDGAGNLYVADDPGQRVEVFTTQGGFQRAFGRNVGGAGVDVCTVVCANGSGGPAAGQLNEPTSVAIDSAGTLFVTDGNSSNHRVSVFTAQGMFLRAFGWDVIPAGATDFEICDAVTTCQAGTGGSGPGQLNFPFASGFDCRGALYVADSDNNRVQRFGEPGTRVPPCPSNDFSFGKVLLNKKRGTAKLTVVVPGPGELVLRDKGLKPQSAGGGAVESKNVSAAGKVKLPIKSKGKKRRSLNRRGRVSVKAKVTYTPTNGDPNLKSRKIKLIKRLP